MSLFHWLIRCLWREKRIILLKHDKNTLKVFTMEQPSQIWASCQETFNEEVFFTAAIKGMRDFILGAETLSMDTFVDHIL